jgi:hypothetical protein
MAVNAAALSMEALTHDSLLMDRYLTGHTALGYARTKLINMANGEGEITRSMHRHS